MEINFLVYGVHLTLFGVSFLTLQCFVTPMLRRSVSSNIADGLVIRLSSNDIVSRPSFNDQQTRSFIECVVHCIQTKACLTVYFEANTYQCYLNNDFVPGNVLRLSYTPSAVVDLLGWDPRGLRLDCAKEYEGVEVLCVGDRVTRGANWEWEDEDGNCNGTILTTDSSSMDYDEPYWVEVQWDCGDGPFWYRMGAEGGMQDLACICYHCFCTD